MPSAQTEGEADGVADLRHPLIRECGDSTDDQSLGNGEQNIAIHNAVARHTISGAKGHFAGEMVNGPRQLCDDYLIANRDGC